MRHTVVGFAQQNASARQVGVEILDDENLAQLVNVAHMMLSQRILVILKRVVAVP